MAGGGQGVPTFVMLQLDVITARGREVAAPAELRRDLAELASMGVAGVMVDVWWGIVERDAPKEYEWGAYRDLFRMVADAGLRIHPVLSFHACGHDVGDSASVPLPAWVRNAAEDEDGILYEEDASRHANGDVVSVGADDLPYLGGRTGLGVVRDFMAAFAAAFADMLGTTIVEIQVGLGPCGELRYPSYPFTKWEFPGIGLLPVWDPVTAQQWRAFAHSDQPLVRRYLSQQRCSADDAAAMLPRIAHAVGSPRGGPEESAFFKPRRRRVGGGAVEAPSRPELHHEVGVGRMFMRWYAQRLLDHADRVLGSAQEVFRPWLGEEAGGTRRRVSPLRLAAKVPGVHWWRGHRSRAAEELCGFVPVLAEEAEKEEGKAGLPASVDAVGTLVEASRPHLMSRYLSVARTIGRHGATLCFTCLEMHDEDHAGADAMCAPEALVAEVRACCMAEGVRFSGENALGGVSRPHLQRVLRHAYDPRFPPLDSFTFLRLHSDLLHNPRSRDLFAAFVGALRQCTPDARATRKGIPPELPDWPEFRRGAHMKHSRRDAVPWVAYSLAAVCMLAAGAAIGAEWVRRGR